MKAVGYLIGVITVAMIIEFFILYAINKNSANRTSQVLLDQVASIIGDNEQSTAELVETLKEDYIIRAQTVAYILDAKPEAENDVPELKKIVSMMHIDEIHLFDENGVIYGGSEPKYYGYSFDSGEQMAYFKPMLEDKTLTMCQDVTPNTAEGKNMMYAITWNEAGDQMIQVGIEPVRLLEELRNNEISEVIGALPVYDGISIWVADEETGSICGATDDSVVGKTLDDIGIGQTKISEATSVSTAIKINGYTNYCHSKQVGDYIVIVANSTSTSTKSIFVAMLIEFVYLFAAGVTISYMFKRMLKMNNEKDAQMKREEELTVQSYADELTGLHNRRAYEADIAAHHDYIADENFVYILLDVNGLKKVNDSLGHMEGDLLLMGAAACMKQCFEPYGKVYRVGGDEFVAMIYADAAQLQTIRTNFETAMANWSGHHLDHLSISCGYVAKRETEMTSIHAIAKLADKVMYEAKAEYYRKESQDE